MANPRLYAPIMADSYVPAFVGGTASPCKIYFELSKYSSYTIDDIKTIHLSVVKQNSEQSVVSTTSGFIVTNKILQDNNGYYVPIDPKGNLIGDAWKTGQVYKVKIRLCLKEIEQAKLTSKWMSENTNAFSEWSTYCLLKVTSRPTIDIPFIGFNNKKDTPDSNKQYCYDIFDNDITFEGSYSNDDIKEILYSYKVSLYNDNNDLIESSNVLYCANGDNRFFYHFDTPLKDREKYHIRFSYSTLNKYEEEYDFYIQIMQLYSKTLKVYALTQESFHDEMSLNKIGYFDNDYLSTFYGNTSIKSLTQEEDEGVLVVKFFSPIQTIQYCNLCLRRADSKDNFTKWRDIKIVQCNGKFINDLDPILDYTIESGVFYKYMVQEISPTGIRSATMDAEYMTPAVRQFEYTYLLGENNKQLKVKFNANVSGYRYNVAESKVETIGGKYPIINRNGHMKYRSFSLEGLISYNMDDNNLFISNEEIYKDNYGFYADLQYKNGFYDYKREFDFREKVLEFLQDGKPKLLKSATEGNIIVSLTDVNTQSEKALNRLISSFSCEATEIDEVNYFNYIKYNFINVGDWTSDFGKTLIKIGQLNTSLTNSQNILKLIKEKYDFQNENVAGNKITLKNILNLKITFCDKQYKFFINDTPYLGYGIKYNDQDIYVNGVYVFDEELRLNLNDKLSVIASDDAEIPVLIDFLYEVELTPWRDRERDYLKSLDGVGQISGVYHNGDNLYKEIYSKYYFESGNEFRLLDNINWLTIEANPGTVFKITDFTDAEGELHEINFTGVLSFEDKTVIRNITYEGVRENGHINKDIPSNALIDYGYTVVSGKYKE